MTTESLSNRHKRKVCIGRAFIMAMFLALFSTAAYAQTTTTIFMRDGSTTIKRDDDDILFYDSHGPSAPSSATSNYWDTWYNFSEEFTYVFKPEVSGDKIKVTFNTFPCYNWDDNATNNCVSIGNWALRLNDDFLNVYEGNGVNADNLIASYTGNSKQSFTIMADGAITFHFVSNSRYREEGWFATVQLVESSVGMSAQAPFIRRSTCNDAAEILPTTLNAEIWYTTDGTDPIDPTNSSAELYKGEIDFPASGDMTVKAASKLQGGTAWSGVVTVTFTDDDRIPVPGVPTITQETGSNTVVMTPAAVPASVNETYVVRYTYTTDGSEPAEPDLANSTLYTDPINCVTPNTRYKAKTFGLSCSNWVSTATATHTVSKIYCPEPVIDLEQMVILATEAGATYNIIYTLNGTEPSLDQDNGTVSATTVSLAGIEYGTTIKALAFKMNGTDTDTNYEPSAVVSAIYVPTDSNGNTQNGTYGNIVLLDDREDHSWSYYSDSTNNPIYSMNPADVKITYYGNGTDNMTPNGADVNPDTNSDFTENATNVHVNFDANENQFVYIKTLENDDPEGAGNTYTYTTIPNPFQVRPIHHSSKGGGEVNVGANSSKIAEALRGDAGDEDTEIVRRASIMDQSIVKPDNGSDSSIKDGRAYTEVNDSSSDCVSIGETSANYASGASYGPYHPYYKYNYNQIVYDGSSLPTTISTIGFKYHPSTSSSDYSITKKTSVDIYFGETTEDYLDDWMTQNNLTLVYSGDLNFDYTDAGEWKNFTLSSSFTHDQSKNLVVVIYDKSGDYESSYYYSGMQFYYAEDSNNNVHKYAYTDTQSYITVVENSDSSPSISSYTTNSSTSYYPVARFCSSTGTNPTIKVTPTTPTITINHAVQLTATSTNATGAPISWSSSDTNVATVVTNSKDTSTATVTGVAAGTADITASITVDGQTYSATSEITVEEPSYCPPAPTSIDGTGIHPVVFGSGDETVNNESYPSTSPYYGNYTSMIGAYQQGSEASVEITYNTGYTYGTLIWVDWDNDYTFEDSEIVASGTSDSDNPITMTFTFTVPSDQTVGYYRMRIGAADSYFDSYLSDGESAHDPCSTGTYKVFHDYTLHVTASVDAPETPVITVASGTYTHAFTTTITCSTPGADIYYTTDGSNPSASNEDPISSGDEVSINETCTLKAVAVKDGAVSAVASASYLISASGGGSLTCENFEDYSSSANSSYNTSGSLPYGWAYYYQKYYHGNSSYAPHLYNGNLAMDGVGIIMTAGYDEYDSDGGGSSSTYIGRGYWVKSPFVLVEGATVTFNTWVESTSYGTMTYGYFDSDDSWHSLGTATTAYYSGATNEDGITSFTVPAAAAGDTLYFRWVYSTSTSGDNYSAVIDNVCQQSTGAPQAPVFDLAEGEYTGTQTVTITYPGTSTEGVTMYYTTDGSTPSASNGTPITSGSTVPISTTTTLQAIAVNSYGQSAVTSATYTISTGAQSLSDFRGFYKWRVKSISSGMKIKVDGTEYSSSQLTSIPFIDAETDVQFVTDDAEGNEVEFEALWAQAYVGYSDETLSDYLNSNVGYERNFIVLAANEPGSDLVSSYPATITAIYPNGTTDGSTAATSVPTTYYVYDDYYSTSDTKFENIVILDAYYSSNSGEWNYSNSYHVAGGYDLIYGRGVTPHSYESGSGLCVGKVLGFEADKDNSTYSSYNEGQGMVNNTIRIENGEFGYLYLLNGWGYSYSSSKYAMIFNSTVNVRCVLGSDYDRATSTNTNLYIAAAEAAEIEGSDYSYFSSESNKDNLTFDWYVKSGTFNGDKLGSGAGGTETIYVGSGSSSRYLGKRRITLEGGILAGIAGGLNSDDSNDNYDNNYTTQSADDVVMIRIKGGHVRGPIYGAAQYAGATGGRKMVITGGEINGWIAGGCNGTRNTGGELFGSTKLYIGGDAQVVQSSGDPDIGETTEEYGTNGAKGGNVFGAGCGIKPIGYDASSPGSSLGSLTVGKVYGSTIVIADNTTIGRDVYGGGNFGFVADETMSANNTDKQANIHILGGTVNGNVFGGSNNQVGQTVNIAMTDGTVAGNIYGGSNTWGTINQSATVSMSGGAVSNIFGGGYGSATSMNSGTTVSVSGGDVSGNVYGGGAEGTVTGNTDVSVSGGTVTDVFGAGQGATGIDANVNGNTKVTISGGTVNGAVYGGGEQGTIAVAASETTELVTKTIGSQQTHSNAYGPVDGYYKYGYTQTIYQQSDLVAGTIQSIAYNYYGTYEMSRSLDIYMKVTSSNTSSWISSGFTKVYSGTVSFTSSGWKTITLDTPFEYDGSSNLVVVVYDKTGSYDSYYNDSYFYLTENSSSYSGHRYYFSNSAIDTPPSNAGSATTYYPDTRFVIETTSEVINTDDLSSTVSVTGGEVKGDVFGGGKLGTTDGATFVNVTGGIVRQNVFAGAYGTHGSVYVGGLKTLNIMGGRIYGSVYGGSRNANDALALTGYDEEESAATSITNISGGQIEQHVYAAGYYGNSYGSVYAFIGLNAINDAPNHSTGTGSSGLEYVKNKLLINGTVWAGGDWGTFNGTFGGPTVSGNSNIYIDGEGYNTEGTDQSASNYMNIAGSILGSGTSNDAGALERNLIIRNYGVDIANTGTDADVNPFARASRQSNSIQRFHNVTFDNTHMGFTGQGKINSLNTTEQYSLYEIDQNVRVVNGSTLVVNAPASQLKSFHSLTCDDTYADTPTYTVVNYDGLGSTGGTTDNKVRVNGGSYIEVKYAADPDNVASGEKIYGELEGFFHIMNSNDSDDATCAYARPKQSKETGNKIPENEDNPSDGGFVSYASRYNQYTDDGVLVAEGEQVQVRYENHTPNMRDNSEYFRIWRYGGNHHTVKGVFNAEATATGTDYKTVTVTVQLPAWTGTGSYYRFETTGTSALNTLIDYGSDVLTFNAACAEDPTTDANWMYYDYESEEQVTSLSSTNEIIAANLAGGIDDNPNLNFGLVVTPGQAMSGSTHIITSESDEYLANLTKPFACSDNTKVPTITFTLTYSNDLTANMSWDPMVIPLVQCSSDGTITDYVKVELAINTSTEITSGFVTQIYARMNGGTNTRETATVNVVLPTYNVHQSGENSQFTLVKAEFTPYEELNGDLNVVPDSHSVTYKDKGATDLGANSFGLTIGAVSNPDNTDDWRFVTGEQDGAPGDESAMSKDIGQAGGRSALTFGLTLYYNSNINVSQQTHMGDVTFTIGFTNYEDGDAENNYYSEFTVTAEIYRIGPGKNFYVDGIDGIDATGRGFQPDKSAKTVNYIFNRLGFLPGDNIFVVNEMPITKATTWDGSAFSNAVNIYRYPGGHTLSGENPDFVNDPYTGNLVNITRDLTMKGITMDGMYAEANASTHNTNIYPATCSFDGVAAAPMINIENGGRLNLTTTTSLMNNYNSSNGVLGGAVNVNYGATLAMNMASSISNNISAQGGGVYVDGSMIVADSIYVYDNYANTAMSKQNNVYLAPVSEGSFRVVQIGTSAADAYDELQSTTASDYNTKLGITKEDWANTYEGYMPVVYAESGTESFLDKPYASPQDLVVHDGEIYSLERYVTDEHTDSPLYLYWLGTWVTAQTWNPIFESADAEGYTPYMTAAQLENINTAEKLAWVISLANGENGVDKTNSNYVFDEVVVTDDIDMSANIWVPIGDETDAFSGIFDGNGHVVSGITSPLNRSNMGMFGVTNNATISDLIVNAQFNTTSTNLGAVVGTMHGGTLSNVGANGTLTNNYANGNTGGIVGVNDDPTSGTTPGVIHSVFSAADITGGENVGGLVAINKGNILNSYSNTVLSDGEHMAGLATTNQGLIENCYAVVGTQTYPAFAYENAEGGTIQYCYADNANGYVNTTASGTPAPVLQGHGTYSLPIDRNAYRYMYDDNKVTLVSGTSPYVVSALSYANNQIDKWPGLLSTLNQWVKANSTSDLTYTSWLRPTSNNINGDLPVLTFPKDNCLATVSGRALRYSAFDDHNNGLDDMLNVFEDNTAYVFLYGNAMDVANVPSANVNVFVNENVVLKQADDAGDFINTTVGVTFDNSYHNAVDFWGNTLAYDWHLMSTPLKNAPLGISYTNTQHNWWDEEDSGQINGVSGGYLPEGLGNVGHWDFYCYDEPNYHWINFKRNSSSHYHYEEPHDAISYDNETSLVPGKGYMAAIDQDSYLSNTGTLNKGDVTIKLTCSGDPNPAEGNDPTSSKDYGSNLVGNPYQAYLNLNTVARGTGYHHFYIYEAESGNYVPYSYDQSENNVTPSQYIHPHQAFFVLKDTGAAESFTLTPKMATDTMTDGSYLREERINYPVVNLFVNDEGGRRDLAIIELERPELGGARKTNSLRNANFKLSAYYGDQDYALLFTPKGTERVPVHFTTPEENGSYTMTWGTCNATFTSLFLVDNLTGAHVDMLHNESYTFNASSDDYAARFYITYNCTGVEEFDTNGDGDFAYFDGSEWIINGEGMLQLVDMTGRVLESQYLSGEQSRVRLEGYAAGVYVLRLGDGDKARNQKIVIR